MKPLDTKEQNRNILPSQQLGASQNGTKQVRYGCATKQGTKPMLAPFATLAFLLVLWGVAVLVTHIFAHSKLRIAMALRGEEPRTGMSLVIRSRTNRGRVSQRQPMRARPQLRAAA
jgi:hypothetical protein